YRDATVDDAYDVELRLVGLDRRDVESISQLYVRVSPRLPAGGRFRSAVGSASPAPTRIENMLTRIDNVVSFETGNAPARIDRLDRQRKVAIPPNTKQG